MHSVRPPSHLGGWIALQSGAQVRHRVRQMRSCIKAADWAPLQRIQLPASGQPYQGFVWEHYC